MLSQAPSDKAPRRRGTGRSMTVSLWQAGRAYEAARFPLAGFENRLADSGKTTHFDESARESRLARRNSVGVMPVSALKARLNGPSELKPASSAMVRTGTSV